ncbi:MAG: hypothetical protein IT181_26950 [Acidobacteria bacterium]|nr:hypothetical protein [Acidobacteriota bacterium]
MSRRAFALATLGLSLLAPALAYADVKTQERTQVRFEGAIGKMVNMFGGRGAREGLTTTVSLKGQRMLSITGDTGEIIDLAEEKVYTLDLKGKSYSVMTFAEMRKRMEEAMAKAEKDAAAAKPEPEPEARKGEPQKEYEVDFAIAPGPGAKAVAGTDTKEQIATITVREKGKTLEEAGGLVLETHLWMAPKVPALQELNDFRAKYAQKVYGPMMAQAAPNMTQAMAMYPQMKDAMAKFADEAKKLNGSPLLTEMVFIAAVPPGSQSEQKAEPAPGLGGLLGGLGRFRTTGNDAPAPAPAAAAAAPGRSTVFTTTTETLQITPSATDADVALPAGLKLK